MERRIVRMGVSLQAALEHRPATTREFRENIVLNLLQPHQQGTARFTVEGEGANIWIAEHGLVLDHTEPVRMRRAPC